MFEDALWVHKQGRYTLSIPALAAQFEGIVRHEVNDYDEGRGWRNTFLDTLGHDRENPPSPSNFEDFLSEFEKRELETLRTHRERIGGLVADRDALLNSLIGVAPDALNSLTPEERHHVYKMLKLRVIVGSDGALEVSGAFGDGFAMCHSKTPRASRFQNTHAPALRFRILL